MKKAAIYFITCLSVIAVCGFGVQASETVKDGMNSNALPELDCVIEPSDIVDVGSSVPGVVESIGAFRSDLVKKGIEIARIESSVERASLELVKERADLNTSIRLRQQTAALGHLTQKRNKVLLQKKVIAVQAMDQLKAETRIAELQVRQEKDSKRIAKLEMVRAQAVLDRRTIRSPVDGVVVERFKSVGEFVDDEPVMRVAQLDPLNVEVIVPVEYLGRIVPGMQAEVKPGVSETETHVATVERVDRVADAASGTYGVRLSLSNPDYKIHAGLRCSLGFLLPKIKKSEEIVDNSEESSIVENQEIQEEIALEPLKFQELNKVVKKETVPVNFSHQKEVRISDNSAKVSVVPSDVEKQKTTETKISKTSNTDHSGIKRESTVTAQLNTVSGAVTDVEKTDGISTFEQPGDESDLAVAAPSGAESKTVLELDKVAKVSLLSSKACYSIGPLANETLLGQLFEKLETLPATQTIRKEFVNKIKHYIVLAKQDPNPQNEPRLLERLAMAGVNDRFLMTRGRNKGRVSLGVYNGLRTVKERQNVLRAKGFETELLPRYKKVSQFWLDVSVPSKMAVSSRVHEIVASATSTTVLKAKNCQEVQTLAGK